MDKQERWYTEEMDLTNQTVADVGANVGRLSQFFWDAGKGSNTVISVEPLPQNLKRIRSRIKHSKADTRFVEPCVDSDESGKTQIQRFHNRETGWNSAVVQTQQDIPNAVNGKIIDVDAKLLSQIAPLATIVKIDIEGHEYAVIDEAIGKLELAHTRTVELHMIPNRPLGQVIAQFMDHDFSLAAATQKPGDRSGRWFSMPITPALEWNRIPIAQKRADGTVFKMLHVMAKRQR